MKELGEIDMVSRALATLELVTPRRRAARIPAVHLEGHAVLSTATLSTATASWLQPRCASCSTDQG
jgi:hypothetical protein